MQDILGSSAHFNVRTRLSCRRFLGNQVRLQLFALAYNLGNFLRQLALSRPVRT